MDQRIQAEFPSLAPMVGYAATAAFRSDAPPIGGDAYGSMEKQLEQFATLAGPAVVVFQDLDSPSVSATFGEILNDSRCGEVRTARLFSMPRCVAADNGRRYSAAFSISAASSA